MKPSNLPRIYVLLAREAPLGVIISCGPGKRNHLVLWRTDTDTFEPGQWFNGTIFESCSDISSSGKYLIYAATKHDTGYTMTSWTAISKPPYFTALAIWNREEHVGGGVFRGERDVLINQPSGFEKSAIRIEKPGIKVESLDSSLSISQNEMLKLRLNRDGWLKTESKWTESFCKRFKYSDGVEVLIYQWFQNNKTNYFVADKEENAIVTVDGADWADFDKNGDLLFARDGKVFRLAHINEAPYLPPIENAKELLDLSKYSFEEVPPPSWAKKW